LAPLSPNGRAQPPPADNRPVLIIAVAVPDIPLFPAEPYTVFSASTTKDAIRLIERWRPRLVAIDWDDTDFDADAICAAARQHGPVAILAVIGQPERAPAPLIAGCHSILLKPFPINLAAARLGRLCRDMPAVAAASRSGATLPSWGTNRVWTDAKCPKCGQGDAVCFEYSSYRRSWYACLKCEHVWLGVRRE
jgi:DNA-binding response OmpR family regulator